MDILKKGSQKTEIKLERERDKFMYAFNVKVMEECNRYIDRWMDR